LLIEFKWLVRFSALFTPALAHETAELGDTRQGAVDLASLVKHSTVVVAFKSKLNAIFVFLRVGPISPVPIQVICVY